MNEEVNAETRYAQLAELQRMVDDLVRHNWDLKALILRYGDKELKERLDKLMKKYSSASTSSDAA